MNQLISIFLVTILAPVFLVTAVLVFVSIGSPIFFKQDRKGKSDKVFVTIKFRTLRGVDKVVVSKNEYLERTTPITRLLRKLKLDELPQLFNIMRSEMNFFGPRPLSYDYYLHPLEKYRNLRLSVAPGVIGLAQVLGLDHSNARRRLACDIFYIRNTSFFLKIKILLLLFRRLIFPAIDDPTDDLFSHRLKK